MNNNENIIIEFLKEEYYDSACLLINRVFKDESNKINNNSIFGKINDNLKILCARNNKDIVGLAVMSIMNKPFSDYKFLYLDYVCTHPNYQHMGIGSKIIDGCEMFAKSNDCKYITFTSNYKRENAHNFYKKHGYLIISSAVFKKEI